MTQQEVINIMKDRKWHTLDELTDVLGRSKNTILVNINKIDNSCGYVIERKRVAECRKIYRLTKKLYRLTGKQDEVL